MDSELRKVKRLICFCELSHKIMLVFCKPILKLRKNWVHSSTQKGFERKRVKCTKYQKKTCCFVHITRHVVFGTIYIDAYLNNHLVCKIYSRV